MIVGINDNTIARHFIDFMQIKGVFETSEQPEGNRMYQYQFAGHSPHMEGHPRYGAMCFYRVTGKVSIATLNVCKSVPGGTLYLWYLKFKVAVGYTLGFGIGAIYCNTVVAVNSPALGDI